MAAANEDGSTVAPAVIDEAEYSRLTAAHARAIVRYDAALHLRNAAMLSNAALVAALKMLSATASVEELAACEGLTKTSEQALRSALDLWKEVSVE